MRKLILPFILALSVSTAFAQTYTVYTLAGDTAGFQNGTGTNALFNAPAGIAVDTAGNNVYVADYNNNLIRKIIAGNGVTTTFAGDTLGFRDGTGTVALFNRPIGICTDDSGNVYVADTYNNAIRKITTAGMVTTISGKGSDSIGYRDGAAANALFYDPVGVAVDKSGNIYVTDNGNDVVRKISTLGIVSTFAGNDTIGYVNGNADSIAEFASLAGIAVDDSGNVYVSEIHNNAIREISKGVVFNIGGTDTIGMDTTIYTVSPGYRNGAADTSLFDNPTGLVVDKSGNVYVCDEYNNVIREISKGVVTTFAGNSQIGLVNGPDSSAEFFQPLGIALDNHGNFYVADNGNNVVRVIYPPGVTGIRSVINQETRLLAYPNPSSSVMTIVSSANGIAELLDLTGRTVWTNDEFRSPYTFSTTDISPGVYFLRITNGSQSAVCKVVIAR
jgi:DNA-binding beta-propeller fold protein YncE